MTQETKRMLLAERIDGWTECHCTAGLPCGIRPGDREHSQVPKYFDDPRALRVLETHLTEKQWDSYIESLFDTCGIESPTDNPNLRYASFKPLFLLGVAERTQILGVVCNLW